MALPSRYHAADLIDPELGLVVHRSTQAPEVPEHDHDFAEVVLVERGTAEHRVRHGDERARPYRIGAGDGFAIAPGERHAYHAARGLVLHNLLFLPEVLAAHRDELRSVPGLEAFLVYEPVFRRETELRSKLHLDPGPRREALGHLAAIREECAGRRPGFRLVARARFVELLVLLGRCYGAGCRRTATAADGAIDRALAFMEEHLGEKLSLDAIAREAYLSPHHFCEAFRKAVGAPPLAHLRRLRLAEGRRLLADTDLGVTAIALEVGCTDASHFARLFKAEYGQSPSAWRRSRV